MIINCGIVLLPIGRVGVGMAGRRFAWVGFCSTPEEAAKLCKQYYPRAEIHIDAVAAAMASPLLERWVATGELPADSIEVQGTELQVAVWKKLKAIPRGEVRSYKQIAKSVDKPSAARAVANACGANPVCLLIPCHRVIESSGGLGGYAGGLPMKKRLLTMEGIDCSNLPLCA